MQLAPADLLEFGARHVWLDDDRPTTLVRVNGPPLELDSGTLVFADATYWDPSVSARLCLEPGRLATVLTAVDGPPKPRAPAGVFRSTAVAAGSIESVMEWRRAVDGYGGRSASRWITAAAACSSLPGRAGGARSGRTGTGRRTAARGHVRTR